MLIIVILATYNDTCNMQSSMINTCMAIVNTNTQFFFEFSARIGTIVHRKKY